MGSLSLTVKGACAGLLIFKSTNGSPPFLEVKMGSSFYGLLRGPRHPSDFIKAPQMEEIWWPLMAHKWNANDDLLLTSPTTQAFMLRCRPNIEVWFALPQIVLAGKWSGGWSDRLKDGRPPSPSPPLLPCVLSLISSSVAVIWSSRGRCWRFIKVDKWTQELGIMGNPYGNGCGHIPL
jgi:hypothetical protein